MNAMWHADPLCWPILWDSRQNALAEQRHVPDALRERLSALDKHPPPLRLPWHVSLRQKLLSPLTDSYTEQTTPPMGSVITALLPAPLRHSARRVLLQISLFLGTLVKLRKATISHIVCVGLSVCPRGTAPLPSRIYQFVNLCVTKLMEFDVMGQLWPTYVAFVGY
jgi:hypothetical protein